MLAEDLCSQRDGYPGCQLCGDLLQEAEGELGVDVHGTFPTFDEIETFLLENSIDG